MKHAAIALRFIGVPIKHFINDNMPKLHSQLRGRVWLGLI